jgi:sugar phosphate isomerase/epimerase
MHARISVNQICFPGASLDVLAGHWRALHARRVSFVSPTLLADDLSPVQRALAAGDHRVETITHVFLPGQHLSPDPASWQAARENLSKLIQRADTLRARSIYLITGGHGALTWEEAADAFSAAVAPCAAQARDVGIAIMIENAPALYADVHLTHSLRDTVTLAEMAGIGVCIDLFACWTEAGLRDSIERAVPRCGVIQVGDYVYGDRALPSRAVPGDGNIPLQRPIGWALEAGYAGAFDLELLGPRIDREGHLGATARAAGQVGAILQALGA